MTLNAAKVEAKLRAKIMQKTYVIVKLDDYNYDVMPYDEWIVSTFTDSEFVYFANIDGSFTKE